MGVSSKAASGDRKASTASRGTKGTKDDLSLLDVPGIGRVTMALLKTKGVHSLDDLVSLYHYNSAANPQSFEQHLQVCMCVCVCACAQCSATLSSDVCVCVRVCACVFACPLAACGH